MISGFHRLFNGRSRVSTFDLEFCLSLRVTCLNIEVDVLDWKMRIERFLAGVVN